MCMCSTREAQASAWTGGRDADVSNMQQVVLARVTDEGARGQPQQAAAMRGVWTGIQWQASIQSSPTRTSQYAHARLRGVWRTLSQQ